MTLLHRLMLFFLQFKHCMHPRMEIKSHSAPTLFSAILALLVSSLDENVYDYFQNIVAIQISWADKCIHSL